MVISHNLSALNACNNMIPATKQLAEASEKLSSGYRINRAADDASGLAVSEKMRSQIRGLRQASRNCQDGISLVQTFDGALGESHEIIKRVKELAAEAATGTYDNPTDRAAIELEYKQLCEELNNIADTDFNGICMLNGGKLASAKANGLYWADPTELKWKEGTFVNQTDDPDFRMTITKLPALDEMTLITEDEKEALLELNGANVGVTLNKGTPVFCFNEPEPKHLAIETVGVKGYIYMRTAGGMVPVAEVHLPNTKVELSSEGKGNWVNSTGSITYNMPESLSNPGKKLSDSKLSDPSTPNYDVKTDEEKFRREYHDWVKSVPGSDKIQFQVTDDRKHFKIIKGADKLRIADDSGQPTVQCDDKTEYDIGTTLYTTTDNTKDNTSGTTYTWENWSFKVSWGETTIRPGEKISLRSDTCGRSSSGVTLYGKYFTPPGSKTQTRLYHSLSLSFMGSNCTVGAETSDENNHGFWLRHGGYTFTLKYDISNMKTGDGKWSLIMSDGRGHSTTYNAGTSDYNALLSKLQTSTSSTEQEIKAAHNKGYYQVGKYDKEYCPPADRSSYSFSLYIGGLAPGSVSGTAWSNTYSNSGLNLGIYDPANPDKGGIEKESAVSGTYTYVNDDLVNTQKAGHWVDQNGKVVDLEKVGIHLPKAYSKDVLSSEDPEYNKPYIPLHSGLSITIKTSTDGPTGTASETVQIWEGDDHFTEFVDESLQGLRYAGDLIIQSNSRSKDAVRFTFKYSFDGMGELLCDTNCSAKGLGMSSLSLANPDDANKAMDYIDAALNKVSMVRSCFGSIHNRLEKKIENLAVTDENITQSESHIRDADIAQDMIEFTKAQIVTSAAQSVLVQSNTRPQQVLQLLE